MPRYKFHVYDDDHTIDYEGQEYPDLDAARTHAVKAVRRIMAEELALKGEITLSHWIEIEDETGEMNVVSFGETVKVNP